MCFFVVVELEVSDATAHLGSTRHSSVSEAIEVQMIPQRYAPLRIIVDHFFDHLCQQIPEGVATLSFSNQIIVNFDMS